MSDDIPCAMLKEELAMGQMTVRLGDDVGTAGQVSRLTREERVARGKEARAEVPRSHHAEFAPAADRPDPVKLLQGDDALRVAGELARQKAIESPHKRYPRP